MGRVEQLRIGVALTLLHARDSDSLDLLCAAPGNVICVQKRCHYDICVNEISLFERQPCTQNFELMSVIQQDFDATLYQGRGR